MSKLFCPHCGKQTVSETETGNSTEHDRGELYVAEEFNSCTECFDNNVRYYKCDTCAKYFYAS